MPYTIFASLNLGSLKETYVIIQLVDMTYIYLKGVIEDVIVNMDKMIFPIDFYVLDIKDDCYTCLYHYYWGEHLWKQLALRYIYIVGS